MTTTVSRAPAAAREHHAPRRLVVWSAPALALMLAAAHALAVAINTDALAGYLQTFQPFAVLGALSFGTLGSLVARAQPGNRVAGIAAAIGWGFALAAASTLLSGGVLAVGWAGGEWLVWLSGWVWLPPLLAIPTLLLLRFPTGRLLSLRWAWVERAAVLGIGATALQWAFSPYAGMDVPPGPGENPLVDAALSEAAGVVGLVVLPCILACLVGFGLRYARAGGTERLQLQWVLLGVGAAVVLVVGSIGLGPDMVVLPALAQVVLALAFGVAMLRHRLWDVQLVIDRSLTYGVVSVLVLLLYAAAVEALAGVLGRTTGAPLAATALAVVAVLPLRDRVQRLVVGLRYGDRGDPYAALGRLGAQLDAAGDRSALLADVTEAVSRAMHLAGAAIVVDGAVLASSGRMRPAALEVPLVVRGEQVGTLEASPRDRQPLTAADRRLLGELARHVAQTVRAERLHAELEASRARLVTAREEERRRIRRDLHDELGPTLSAAALAVEQVRYELDGGPPEALARLDDTTERLRATVRRVRALVQGLRPASLDELGLAGATRELARRLGGAGLAIEVRIEGDVDDVPAAIDVAAYRIIGEAVTNVVRHAGARTCRVALRRADGALVVVVSDDGRGLAGEAAGVGRQSMEQRAAELGGTCRTRAGAEGGTVVEATLPLGQP